MEMKEIGKDAETLIILKERRGRSGLACNGVGATGHRSLSTGKFHAGLLSGRCLDKQIVGSSYMN